MWWIFFVYQYTYRRLKRKRKGAGHESLKYLLAVLILDPFGDYFMVAKVFVL